MGIALAALFISSPGSAETDEKGFVRFTSDQIHWAPFRDGAEIATLAADSDEVAQAFRDDIARRSDMMPPGSGASLADDLCHSVLGRSIAGDVERTACPV